MTATLGLGGILAARLHLSRRTRAVAVLALMSASAGLLVGGGLIGVVVAQLVVALLLVALGVHFSRLVRDAVPSSLRSGVSSGVGTLSWGAFLPCALLFGGLSAGAGLCEGALVLGALAVVSGVAAVLAVRRSVAGSGSTAGAQEWSSTDLVSALDGVEGAA
jgi:hypothetical protein